jgi:hypothetical protein
MVAGHGEDQLQPFRAKPPPQSEALHWGSTHANRAGTFRRTFTVNREVEAGRWIAIACQRGCRIKAGASFRTVLGQG